MHDESDIYKEPDHEGAGWQAHEAEQLHEEAVAHTALHDFNTEHAEHGAFEPLLF